MTTPNTVEETLNRSRVLTNALRNSRLYAGGYGGWGGAYPGYATAGWGGAGWGGSHLYGGYGGYGYPTNAYYGGYGGWGYPGAYTT